MSEVIQEPLPSPMILVKKSVFLVTRKNGFTKTILWTPQTVLTLFRTLLTPALGGLARLAKTFSRYTGHVGPSGPKLQIKTENEFPGPLASGSKKVQKRVENEYAKSLEHSGGLKGGMLKGGHT